MLSDKSDFFVCGVIDVKSHMNAEKMVLDEIIEYRKKQKKELEYFSKALHYPCNHILQKLFPKNKRK